MTARIFVVEDESVISRDIRATLEDLGYVVAGAAETGEAALAAIATSVPDLVLMDIHLRGAIDGIETAARLRQAHGVPIVYLTSYADDATLARAKGTGAYGYVLKPFTDRDLRTAIEVAIEKREMEQRLAERERWFATTLRSIADAVIAVDRTGLITFMNAAAEALTGVASEEARGAKSPADLFETWRQDGPQLAPVTDAPIARALAGNVVIEEILHVRTARARGGRWHSINASPVRDDAGNVCGAVMVSRDITELRDAMTRLEQVAIRDELTGLLNRRGFAEQAERLLALANRTSRPLALVYIDLNGMKPINDQLGHAAGDQALVEIAAVMRTAFRVTDVLARVGGDEFVVLAPDYTEDDDGRTLRRRFVNELDLVRNLPDRTYRLSASLGVIVYDPRAGARSLEQLLAEADTSMYVAKEQRKREGTQRLEVETI